MNRISQKFRESREKTLLVATQAIGLPARSINLITARGIESSHDAIVFVLNELEHETGVGNKTLSDSFAAVESFLEKLSEIPLGLVSDLNDPRKTYFGACNGNLVECIPALVRLYAEKYSQNEQSRTLDILSKRFGLDKSKVYTLEELGTYYDITRERVRQIEARSVKDIGGILRGSLQPKNWRICPKIIKSYILLTEETEGLGDFVSEATVQSLLESDFGKRLDCHHLSLFMEVAGYNKLPVDVLGFKGRIRDSWYLASKYSRTQLELVFRALNPVFDSPEGLPVFEITVTAKKKLKKNFDQELLELAIETVVEIERFEGNVRVKFEYLRSAADKAFRVLSAASKPTHYSEMCREINLLSGSSDREFRAVTDRNLTNQLGADDRFSPIGKSGRWALSSWAQVQNVTIADALERVLHQAGRAMKYEEILAQLLSIRPDASERSVQVYINDGSRFTRVGRSTFALKAWKVDAAPKRTRKKNVTASELAKALHQALLDKNPRLFAHVIAEVANQVDLSEASVRQRIAALKAVEIRPLLKGRGKEVYCENLDALMHSAGAGNRLLLRDAIQNEIRAILLARPNEPVQKGELYRILALSVPCLKPTFYQYLSNMEEIDQYSEGGRSYVVFRHVEEEKRIAIDVGQYGVDDDVKNQLQRPLEKLTVAEIDMALFELGLLFEDALRKYLMKVRAQQTVVITSKDLSRLSSMISCAERIGSVTKGHHLTTLREERNNRAHGSPLTTEARASLFNKAHYLADLFVKYICHFRNEERKI